MVVATFALSLLFLYMLAIAVSANISYAGMLSFGWSNRIVGSLGRDVIADMYRDNRDTSPAKLGRMLDEALRHGYCRHVALNGGLQWRSEEVSPSCNCIRNVHVEYVKSVTPMGVHLSEDVMNTAQSKLNSLWISNRVKSECFQNLRHTQVEDISDPYTDESTGSFTNIVGVALYWNVVACITSSFVFYFDVLTQKDDASAGEAAAATAASAEADNGGGPAAASSVQNLAFFLLSFAGLLWPLILLPLFCGMSQSVVMIAIALVFYFVALVAHGMRHREEIVVNNRYPARKKIVYWIGYTITAPVLLMAANMLAQKRDVLYNFAKMFMVVCIGMCSLASEMTYTAYEHFFIRMYQKKKEQPLPPPSEIAFDIDTTVIAYREKKNGVIKLNLAVTLILLIAIGCTSFPSFGSTPFSNAYSAVFVAAPVMLVIPPLITGRIISLVPSAEDAQPSFAGGTSGQTWVLELLNIELLARAVFTVAVMYDLCSLGTADNVVVDLE